MGLAVSVNRQIARNGEPLTFRQDTVTLEDRTTGSVSATTTDYAIRGYVTRSEEDVSASGTGLEQASDVIQVAAIAAAAASYSPRPGDLVVERNLRVVRRRMVRQGTTDLYWRLEVAGAD